MFGASPPEAPTVVRYTRRLLDKILSAFHQACDQVDLVVAGWLIRVLEGLLNRQTTTPTENRRRHVDSVVAAHERLWNLRSPVWRTIEPLAVSDTRWGGFVWAGIAPPPALRRRQGNTMGSHHRTRKEGMGRIRGYLT